MLDTITGQPRLATPLHSIGGTPIGSAALDWLSNFAHAVGEDWHQVDALIAVARLAFIGQEITVELLRRCLRMRAGRELAGIIEQRMASTNGHE